MTPRRLGPPVHGPATQPAWPARDRRRLLHAGAAGLCGATLGGLGGCAVVAPPPAAVVAELAPPSAAAVAELAPRGRLRAAIHFGNPILAARDPAGGEPRGVSVDLARALAERLGVPLQIVTFEAAGRVVAALKDDGWDVGFMAIDPVRGREILYSPPYVIIEGAYLVRRDAPIRANADVDRDGVRVVVGAGSAYDLYLSRALTRARLVRAPTSQAVVDTMMAGGYEVAAGVRQQIEADGARYPDARVLDGRFMVIEQAMGTPAGREAGVAYLRSFVERMKASGFVASALARHGIQGARVAPMGPGTAQP
jgi:polar amino acid transport system substrate-binding protein